MYSSFRQRIGAGIAAAGLATIGLAWTAGASFAEPPPAGGCGGVFNGNPPGSLAITTAPASGSEVLPGDVITVTATWDTDEWVALNKANDCVQLDGVDVDLLSDEEKPTANDGSYQHAFAVPAGTAAGTEICVRAGIHGQPSGAGVTTQKSNVVCFTAAAIPTTTTTTAPPTTTTTAPQNTTSSPPASTTTTTAPPTTTTTAPQNTTSSPPASTTSTTPPPATTSTPAPTNTTGAPPDVLGEQLARSSGDGLGIQGTAAELPRTGSATRGLLLAAGLAMLLGGLAVTYGKPSDVTPEGTAR